MKVVVEMDERDYNTMKNGFLVVGVTNGKPLVDVLTDFVEWENLPFPQKNVFMNAPVIIAETYLKEKKDAISL